MRIVRRSLLALPLLSLLVTPVVLTLSARSVSAATNTVDGLSVFVGYAEDKEIESPVPANFPTPWAGAPNTIFLGGTVPGQSACGTLTACYDAGAIRLDNPGTGPVTVSSVSVDDHSSLSGGNVFNLWGSFAVPPGESVILTENPPGDPNTFDDFDTSEFPSQCTPITVAPTVTFTIGGAATTLVDSTHVLDDGGIDRGSCTPKQNESIQWRAIGSPGTDAATLTLSPSTTTLFAGQPVTETATLLDGSGLGLPNTTVTFNVTSGPDAGRTATAITNASGQASFTYTPSSEGEDAVVASMTTVGTFASNATRVMWVDDAPGAWSSGDIGSPPVAGSQSFNQSTGTWTVSGGGADIAGGADQFHAVWQTVSSGSGIAAHVTAQSDTSPGAKAGVMLRTSTDPGSPYYGVFVTPGDGIVVQERGAENGPTTTVAAEAGSVPAYLWVVGSSTTLEAYSSSDGYTWIPIPGSTVSGNLGASVLAALAVTAQSTTALSTVTMDAVVISPAPPAPAPPEVCPGPWTCADIGSPALAGTQSFDPNTGTWTISAGGSDITGTSDQFHFVWQTLTGDGSVVADVLSQTDSSSNAKAGIMLRASTDPGAPNYAVLVSPGVGIKVQVRSAEDGTTSKIANPTGTAPVYLKVTRSGNTFSAYTSSDGATWTLIAGSTFTFNPGTALLAGLAATSHNAGVVGTAAFDDVQVSGSTSPPPPPPPAITLTPATQSASTGASQTVTGTVLDGSGNPLSGTTVTFDVVSGPNAGEITTAVADSAGHATFADTTSIAGPDLVQASFVDSTSTTRTSNQVQVIFTTPTSGGLTISNLTVNDTTRASQWSVQPNLQVGDVLYADRTYSLTAAPSLVIGDIWIRDTNGSKAFTGNPLVTFTINQQATVLVGMDKRVSRPSWLDASWTDTGTTESGTGPVTYELFERTFAAGPVALGPMGPSTDSMYTIAVS
jgi:hypothetical protein